MRDRDTIRLRALDSLAPLATADTYVTVAQLAPDAARLGPVDWSRPVEGWTLWP